MRRTVLVLTLLALPSAALAQTPDSLPVGNRLRADWSRLQGEEVRIQGPDSAVTGRVRAVRGDTLVLASGPDAPLRPVRVDTEHTVERWTRHDPSRAWMVGMGIAGMAGGAALGWAVARPSPCAPRCALFEDLSDDVDGFVGAFVGAALVGGAAVLIGRVIGEGKAREEWAPVTPQFSVQGFDSRRGLTVGVILRH